MKKLSNRGFVLAETLIVTIFVLTIFTMIYTNYYPTIGVYEERETYDDVDGKYTAYWIKKLIENEGYDIGNTSYPMYEHDKKMMDNLGYVRFECKEMNNSDVGYNVCANLLNALEISNCDAKGNGCDIFITHYKIGITPNELLSPNFKKTVNGEIPTTELSDVNSLTGYSQKNLKRYEEYMINGHLCAYSNSEDEIFNCKKTAFSDCISGKDYNKDNIVLIQNGSDISYDLINGEIVSDDKRETAEYCIKKIEDKVFPSYLVDYINYLPDYSRFSNPSTKAEYRVIVVAHHKRALNNYYSFSTMEVNK